MFDLVVPTIGRPSLARLLDSIERSRGPQPEHIILVDDRRDRSTVLELGERDGDLRDRITVLPGHAAGPASARNAGWRASRSPWIAFLDDDVIVSATWLDDLTRDIRNLPVDVAGSQGCIDVPLPRDRKPTDWERNVARLETALWITADCAYRRAELVAVGGFDERFRRAYREDADLALRIVARGKRIVRGERRTTHPVQPAHWTISVRLQAGNADDVLMEALHGPAWRVTAAAPRGAYRLHVATVATAAVALAPFCLRKPRIAAGALLAWAIQAAYLCARRIAPGPRSSSEVATMLVTSVAIPFAAVYHRLRGRVRLRALLRDRARAPTPIPPAVLLDRDGTLIVDVPYNADPAHVEPMPGAVHALHRLRSAGVATAVVSNQSGIARGRLTIDAVNAINARVDALLGPLGPVFVCPHDADDGCPCRKPARAMIEAAARELGVCTSDCVVIGDTGADIEAAHAAGACAILVPTNVTLPEEIASATLVAEDLEQAVGIVLGGRA